MNFEMHNKYMYVGTERVWRSTWALIYIHMHRKENWQFWKEEPSFIAGAWKMLLLGFYLSTRNPPIGQLERSLKCQLWSCALTFGV